MHMIGEDFGIMRKGSRHTHACCIKSTSPPPHPSPLLPNISRAFAHASVASIADQSLPSISRTAFSRKHSRPIPPQHIVLISLLFFSLLLSWPLAVSSSTSREAGGEGGEGGHPLIMFSSRPSSLPSCCRGARGRKTSGTTSLEARRGEKRRE